MDIAASAQGHQGETATLFGEQLAGVAVVSMAVAEVSGAVSHAMELQQHLIKNHLVTCSVICIDRLKG